MDCIRLTRVRDSFMQLSWLEHLSYCFSRPCRSSPSSAIEEHHTRSYINTRKHVWCDSTSRCFQILLGLGWSMPNQAFEFHIKCTSVRHLKTLECDAFQVYTYIYIALCHGRISVSDPSMLLRDESGVASAVNILVANTKCVAST
jgi:hypothetical protein